MCGCLREREDPSRPMADAARALYRLTDRFPALLRSNSRCTNLHHPLYHPAPAPPLSPRAVYSHRPKGGGLSTIATGRDRVADIGLLPILATL
jgi:hypothetical protein